MLIDILARKESILSQISSQTDLNNIQVILLLGSHLWGYAGDSSDVDLIIIYKQRPIQKVEPFEDVTAEIQVDLENWQAKMARSNWDNYFQATFCSYPLYGELPQYEFSRGKIVEWFQEKYSFHFDSILVKSTKQGFLTLMSRVFYLNYYFSKKGAFKLQDFWYCEYLSADDKHFLELQLILLFERKDNTPEEKQQIKEIAEKLQSKIIELESK